MGTMDDRDSSRSTTSSGRLKVSITLPRALLKRIRRAANLNKRSPSFEIEAAMEEHVKRVEDIHGLSNHMD